MRFGLENSDQYTIDEMGKTFGLTLERVRQIEKVEINKIRESKIGKQLIA